MFQKLNTNDKVRIAKDIVRLQEQLDIIESIYEPLVIYDQKHIVTITVGTDSTTEVKIDLGLLLNCLDIASKQKVKEIDKAFEGVSTMSKVLDKAIEDRSRTVQPRPCIDDFNRKYYTKEEYNQQEPKDAIYKD